MPRLERSVATDALGRVGEFPPSCRTASPEARSRLDWVASLLAGLGCDFEVLRPEDGLRAALARVAERLQRA